jgi:DNA polymerase-3 subunit delta
MVKEAQELKKWDDLEAYFEKPVKTTILVLCHKHKNFDKRTKSAKFIQTNGVIMTSKKFYENQLPSFVEQIVEENGLKIESRAAHLIVEYIGNDLSRIVHELEKLKLNLKGKKEITGDDIELNIGISKEYNTFELNKALAFKDVLKANRIVDYFASNPRSNPLVLTLGSLQSYFSKIYLLLQNEQKNDNELASLAGINVYNRSAMEEYRTGVKNFSKQKVENIFSLLHEYDLRSKGVNDIGTKEGALLKELVYKILH